MTIVAPDLDRPAARVARQQALAFASEARAPLARLDDPADGEALHDSRVALRRLRSWLRAFGPELALPQPLVARLRRMARATGKARDLEVAVERLLELARASRGAERTALNGLARELARQRDAGRPALRATVMRRWQAVERRLTLRLEAETAQIAPRFATAFAAQLAVATRPFAEPAPPPADWPALHALRIAGKRTRYLLEPVRAALPGAADVLADLKSLQEHLGAVNDAVVLEALIVEHAAAATRAAVVEPLQRRRALRALSTAAFAVQVVRRWRRRLARRHARAVVARLPRLRRDAAALVARLRIGMRTLPVAATVARR